MSKEVNIENEGIEQGKIVAELEAKIKTSGYIPKYGTYNLAVNIFSSYDENDFGPFTIDRCMEYAEATGFENLDFEP